MIPLLYSSICSAIRTHWQALGVYGSRAYVSASVSASVLRAPSRQCRAIYGRLGVGDIAAAIIVLIDHIWLLVVPWNDPTVQR